MPTIHDRNGKSPVKNLGWLIRHASDISHFVVTDMIGTDILVRRVSAQSTLQTCHQIVKNV